MTGAIAYAIDADARPAERGGRSMRKPVLVVNIGAATIETRTAMGMLALDNIDAILGGRPAPSLVT
jgi:lactate dehydrogenase-like 2-hydroxyacid dehydrogenase